MITLGKVVIAAALLATGSAAIAGTYDTQAAFDAAHPGLSTTSFTGMTSSITTLPNPFTYEGLTIEGTAPMAVSTNFWGSKDSILDDRFGGFLDISFSAPQSAVGFYVAGSYGDYNVNVSAFDGGTLLFNSTVSAGGVFTSFKFFGLDNVGSISHIRIDATNGGGFVSVADVAAGSTSPAPEPASWAMMLGGFGLVGGAMRARRRSAIAYA